MITLETRKKINCKKRIDRKENYTKKTMNVALIKIYIYLCFRFHHSSSFSLILPFFFQDEMTMALQAMRVPFEEQIRLKEINISSNPLLNRRKKVHNGSSYF